jgi:hypothetical protein
VTYPCPKNKVHEGAISSNPALPVQKGMVGVNGTDAGGVGYPFLGPFAMVGSPES